MKKLWIVLFAVWTAGCAGTGGMRSSGGYSSGTSGSSGSTPDIYKPNFGQVSNGLDSWFQPYRGD